VPLPAFTGDEGYLAAWDEVVDPLVRRFAPDLILVGAGQDPAASDPLGKMAVTLPAFRALADRVVALAGDCCGGRLVAFLEGGYSLQHTPLAIPGDSRRARGPAWLVHARLGGHGRPRRRVGRRARRDPRCGARAPRRRERVMRHDRLGWWIAEAGAPPAQPSLAGDVHADVVVVGGGYAGMWAAWHVLEQAPGARVVVSKPSAAASAQAGATAASSSRSGTRCPR
jgi:hypothetical protein